MAIKHLPNGYKPLVNQCGVKFDVQRVCTEENVGPQVLTLYWPSNVEQWALYAASCPNAANSPVSSCGQYADIPDTSQVTPDDAPDPNNVIAVWTAPYSVDPATGMHSSPGDSYYRWRNNFGHPIRILGFRFYADGAVGTSPGGDASQGQNAINRAQGAGVIPAWERGPSAAAWITEIRAHVGIRYGTAAPYIWPTINSPPSSFPSFRQLWVTNPLDGSPLGVIDQTGWWSSVTPSASYGTLQLPVDSANNPYFTPGYQASNQDPYDYVMNPGEELHLGLYQSRAWGGDANPCFVFAPMTIEITYEQAEAHP